MIAATRRGVVIVPGDLRVIVGVSKLTGVGRMTDVSRTTGVSGTIGVSMMTGISEVIDVSAAVAKKHRGAVVVSGRWRVVIAERIGGQLVWLQTMGVVPGADHPRGHPLRNKCP